MPSRKPYGCVFCPTYLLAFLARRAGFLFAALAAGLARGFRCFFIPFGASAADQDSALVVTGASAPATRISTWLVRFRIGVPRPMAAAVNRFSVCPSFTTAYVTRRLSASNAALSR